MIPRGEAESLTAEPLNTNQYFLWQNNGWQNDFLYSSILFLTTNPHLSTLIEEIQFKFPPNFGANLISCCWNVRG